MAGTLHYIKLVATSTNHHLSTNKFSFNNKNITPTTISMNYINKYSLVTTPIEILAEETKASLGNASGFIVKYKGIHFLVTNWHVFSGKNYQTGEVLHSSGALPGFINFNLNHLDNGIGSVYNVTEQPISHFNFKIWFEHPSTEHKFDVAVMPIENHVKPFENKIQALNIEDNTIIEENLKVMDGIFIIGYPLKNLSTPNRYPIYKTGTIASEPNIQGALPHILVDTKTKSGMSGSLVVIEKTLVEEKSEFEKTIHFKKNYLIGIYSGRESISKEFNEAELGIIWPLKKSLIPILAKISDKIKNAD